MKKRTKNEGFRVGALVYLKSGSPLMTIDRVENGRAMCVWFNRNPSGDWNPNLQSMVVPLDAIEKTKVLKLKASKIRFTERKIK